ncbi:DUF2071 domain-containing protein [Halobacillus sp. A1]|uniref:YqjF family protein n=1 Tax=Halobacillus sp. A1 TaxID=2880262 RepID=UPI0020A62744|nr:DUF2071 domain-containing protein [Halobacillus sp. A1]MCP3029896.1 DUF2071 domain-containing protein [Halobacillus sp. A1]
MHVHLADDAKHRSTLMPTGNWMMTQKWENLLFIHFPVREKILKSYIPDVLQLDVHEGEAWLTIIPFEVTDMRIRNLPSVPGLRSFLELNVRTYVKRDGVPGIYFFSLDADKMLAVIGARLTMLPYYYANMSMERGGNTISFFSKRKGKSQAEFKGEYRPVGELYVPEQGSLDHFLVERYYCWTAFGKMFIEVGIYHRPWKLQNAEAEIQVDHMAPFSFVKEFGRKPFFRFSPSLRALILPVKFIK